jgi:hypothetical protein
LVKGLEVLARGLRSTKVRLSMRSRKALHVGSRDVEVNLVASVMHLGDFVGQYRPAGLHLVADLGRGRRLGLGGFLAGLCHV